ncbi:MAG: hypothetical protein M1814_003622 [Vezdaea aestivalis]|nr:MAG: hypothetical protein M1814_003622 [Vezdaea aestivalis]
MPRKAIDSRIPALIRNGIQEKKRSFIVIVGDRAKEVIVHLHYIMSSVDVKQNKSVLWAYKKELIGFSSHRKKRETKIKKEIKRGTRDPNTEDPFELFVSLNNIRYVYYKETERILGNTYGMCVLQDFEAITPNLLARTMETVEGGGLILLLLKGMNSLKQLYTLSMDVHSRYRTEAHGDVTARFNERFILSLGSCESCLVVDDELNVLPISGGKDVKPLPPLDPDKEKNSEQLSELKTLNSEHSETQPLGTLLPLAKTVDQAKALITFIEAVGEKTLRSTVTLTAARGRGKSAALGVAVAAAIAHGYSNIFITSPSPENLKTLFEFIFKGFDKLNYVDHSDYTIIQSTNPDFNKAIVRVNVHRQHRQVIQYIQPEDAHVLGQAELVVIDEAAAIPLPLVRKLMGPYLVFMASTINGYEGTGRSLSLKLIQQLRDQSYGTSKRKGTEDETAINRSNGAATKAGNGILVSSRSLREIKLSEPIRYGIGDKVEKWLNNLLCLDATLPRNRAGLQGCPHPSQCQLLHVNRDTLFSFHPVSEKFLQHMMALYVASHYKNSPNDLQLMSDAPAHSLFVLVPPIDANSTRLPEPLCVIQVALEGQISRQSVLSGLGRGQRAGGDLIPWLVSQQFQDMDFAGLSGARIVRIATNPDYINMGYGSRALSLLNDFYEGKFASLSEGQVSAPQQDEFPRVQDAELSNASLLSDDIKVKDINAMPPLFSKLSERRPEGLDYIGVSYGLTSPLLKFWKRLTFAPVYLRQTPNDLTGEHTCVMLRALSTPTAPNPDWLPAYVSDFHRRFLSLLSYNFRIFPLPLSLSLDQACTRTSPPTSIPLSPTALSALFTPFDLKRLESYADNLLDYHVILDLLPQISTLYFTGSLTPLQLPAMHISLLLALGLQRKDLGDTAKELELPTSQLLALFQKLIRKIVKHFRDILAEGIEADIPDAPPVEGADPQGPDVRFRPVERRLSEELADAGREVNAELKEKQRALIDALPLDKYEIENGGKGWDEAEALVRKGGVSVAVKSEKMGKRKGGGAREVYEEAFGKEGEEGRKGKKKKQK